MLRLRSYIRPLIGHEAVQPWALMEIRTPSPQSNPRAQVGPEPPTGLEGAGPTGSPFSFPVRSAQSQAGNQTIDTVRCEYGMAAQRSRRERDGIIVQPPKRRAAVKGGVSRRVARIP